MNDVRHCSDCRQALSRYNGSARCYVCSSLARKRPADVINLPTGFVWEPAVRTALQDGDWATVLRAITQLDGQRISQSAIARATGLSQSYVSRLVAGSSEPSLHSMRALCDGLRIPRTLAGLSAATPTHQEADTDRRAFLTGVFGAISLAALPIESPQKIGLEQARDARDLVGEIFRLDNEQGGDALCEAAAAVVERVDYWLQYGEYTERVGRELQLALAELAEATGFSFAVPVSA